MLSVKVFNVTVLMRSNRICAVVHDVDGVELRPRKQRYRCVPTEVAVAELMLLPGPLVPDALRYSVPVICPLESQSMLSSIIKRLNAFDSVFVVASKDANY